MLLDDGRTVTADESYVRESILNPGAKIVSGFKNIMPTFQGQMSEEEVIGLVAYVKALGNGSANPPHTGQRTRTREIIRSLPRPKDRPPRATRRQIRRRALRRRSQGQSSRG